MSGRHAFQRPLKASWWTRKPAYRFYILREVTSLMQLIFCFELLWALRALIMGETSWLYFVEALKQPVWMGLNAVILSASLLHTVTWFTLAPKTVNLKIGSKKVSEKTIKSLLYMSWCVVSVLILVFLWSASR